MKKLLTILSKTAPWFVIAYFWCKVDPTKVYTWHDGFWQGTYVIPNWILSFFQEERLCKAIEYTTSYNIFWWIFTVLTSIYSFFLMIGIVMILLGKTTDQTQQ